MALLFIDSFDHYATGDIGKKWTDLNASPTIAATGRTASGLQTNTNSEYVAVTCLGGVSEIICGAAIKVSALPASGGNAIFAVGSSSYWETSLILQADGTFQVARTNNAAFTPGGTTYYTVVGTSSVSAISADVWYYLEWRIFVDNSGSSTVHVNGVEWLDVSSVDTLYSSATLTRVGIGHAAGSGNTTYFDDFYVLSTSGGTVTDFIGDVTVEAILPQTDAVDAGTNAGWTCSTGTDHGALVDESTPNDTDYVSASTNVKDTWNYPDLGVANATIYGVQVSTFAKKDATGTAEFKTLARVTSTDRQGTNTHAPSDTAYAYLRDVWEVNPDDSSVWTVSDINGAEFGVERTA